jgi:hypothetical protein
MFDQTEAIRRGMVQYLNASLSEDELHRYRQLCAQYGKDNVWDTEGVQREFEIEGFLAPFVVVIRKSDHVKGSMQFCHSPRFYFDFTPA